MGKIVNDSQNGKALFSFATSFTALIFRSVVVVCSGYHAFTYNRPLLHAIS